MIDNTWVKWFSDGKYGGIARLNETNKWLLEYEKLAKEELIKTGADHVIYGAKEYDENDELQSVRFYMITYNDKDFYELTSHLPNMRIYALHKM